MAKKKQVKQHSTVTPRQVAAPRYVSTVVIALAIVLFYGYALFAPNASIQWDAVDVHLSSQHYFATELAAGRLVRWTPYIFSGFPFLADPQVGAFYPLNWPFFLAGAGPKAIQAEVALHSLLACSGMYVLLGCWMKDRWARLVGAFAYGLGGFFAGHASHVAMIQGAGLLPWVLYFAESALREKALRWIAACGFATGLIFLAGHFQTGLYCCGALTLYLLARTLSERAQALRALAILAGVAVLSILVAAVVLLPGYELSTQSIRAHMDFSGRKEGALAFPALATLFAPDALGALGDHYSGPADITQYYFYGGLLLIPLALLGLKDTRLRWLALGLLVPSLWYMSGPAGGLYGLVPVPIRAPVNGWFVAALGLALLAAAGAA